MIDEKITSKFLNITKILSNLQKITIIMAYYKFNDSKELFKVCIEYAKTELNDFKGKSIYIVIKL